MHSRILVTLLGSWIWASMKKTAALDRAPPTNTTTDVTKIVMTLSKIAAWKKPLQIFTYVPNSSVMENGKGVDLKFNLQTEM